MTLVLVAGKNEIAIMMINEVNNEERAKQQRRHCWIKKIGPSRLLTESAVAELVSSGKTLGTSCLC